MNLQNSNIHNHFLLVALTLTSSFFLYSPGSSLPVTITATSGTLVLNGIQVDEEDARKARVLYDYESEDDSQISFFADQVSYH